MPNVDHLCWPESGVDCLLWIRSAVPSDESISTVTTMVGLVVWSDSAGEDARFLRPLVEVGERTFRWS